MSIPVEKYVAIDTNIFEHLYNPPVQNCHHVEFLLITLLKPCLLLIDKSEIIANEYIHRLKPYFKNSPNSDYSKLIKGWLHPDHCKKVVITDHKHKVLKSRIKKILNTNDSVDTAFICVAIIKDTRLITNDRSTIIDQGNQKNSRRRDKLLKLAKKLPCRRKSFTILDSSEMYQLL